MASPAHLDLQSLVTLDLDVEPYVLEWPVVDDSEGEALVLIVQNKPEGFLAAVPLGCLLEEILAVGNSPNPPGPVGP